jgi:hypothetical protein
VPFFGAALLKKSLVGSFFIVGEGREYLRWHWAGGVRAGVVEGADGRVHPAFEGGRGSEGPVRGGPGLKEKLWDHIIGSGEEAVSKLGQLDLLGVVEGGEWNRFIYQ